MAVDQHLGSGQNLQLGLIMLHITADSDRPSSLHNLCAMTKKSAMYYSLKLTLQ